MAQKVLVGKYELIERLGRGGMAEVYKAYQTRLDRFVAIKILHSFLADDKEFKDRFNQEAQNVGKLRHPNIVQVYDFDYDPDGESYFMVMEMIEGETLKDYLARPEKTRLPYKEMLRIVRQAMDALAYAHARGMIHRDLKPANLMIEHDQRVVLTDFGIAKIVTGNQFTASGGMVGTPAYMAPEQGLGDVGDERSDLYSVGIIMFQLVTGKLPYDAETPVATILKHLNEPLPELHAMAPDLPEPVAGFILKSMAKDPEDRFQTAEEMLDEMDVLLGEPRPAPAVPFSGALPIRPTDTQTPTETPTRKPAPDENQTLKLPPDTPLETPSRPARAGITAFIVVMVLSVLTVISLATGRVVGIGVALFPTATPTATFTPTASATPSATVTASPSATNTVTATATPTATYTATATATSTVTASATPSATATFTFTPTHTETPTATATYTATATPTLTPSITHTPSSTATPTLNVTATIEAATAAALALTATSVQRTVDAFFLTQQAGTTPTPNYTATARLCVREYDLIKPLPPDPTNPTEFYRGGVLFEVEIEIKNIGDCDWLPGTALYYREGEQFSAPRKIEMVNSVPVKPGESARFVFSGRAPRGQGGAITGLWELRTEGGVLIQPPVSISFFIQFSN